MFPKSDRHDLYRKLKPGFDIKYSLSTKCVLSGASKIWLSWFVHKLEPGFDIKYSLSTKCLIIGAPKFWSSWSVQKLESGFDLECAFERKMAPTPEVTLVYFRSSCSIAKLEPGFDIKYRLGTQCFLSNAPKIWSSWSVYRSSNPASP